MAAKPPIRFTVFCVVILAFFTAGAPVMGQDVHITVNPGRGFSNFSKYAWGENEIAPRELPRERDSVERKIKEIVNRELAKKGYAEDPSSPDFVIRIKAMALPGEMLTSANRSVIVPDGVNVYDSQRPMGPGVSIWLAMTAGARITVIDRVSNAIAWEAEVSKKYKDPEKARRNLDKEMEGFFKKGMKDFPSVKN